MSMATDWAKLLNPEQLAAVTAGEGPTLVLAAAGTGKTRTLTHRVAWLLEQGESPDGILLLTFTNRAAREMMERAQALAGPAIATLWSGTFHHVCHRILRREAPLLGYRRDFAILDRADSLSLLNRGLKELVKDTKHFPKKEVIASLIGKAANTQGDLKAILENTLFEDPVDPAQLFAVAERYAEAKRENNAMDFDDLLVLTLRLFQEHPQVADYYAARFRHVLVDEYQDTNTIQSQLVDRLAARHRNLMAVGDDFQCIYSWRGADFRNIMDFPKRWPDCRIIKLERNYRSAPEILSVANATIAGNPEQFQKTLLPTRPPAGRKPLVAFLYDAAEQNQMVIRHIQRALQSGYRLHAKDVIAYLRLCTGAPDAFSFARCMALLPGVGPKTIDRIWQRLGGYFDPSDETARLKLLTLLPKKAQDDWRAIDALSQDYRREDLDAHGGLAIRRFLDGWYAAYLRRTYDNAEDRIQDIAALASQIAEEQSVPDFLSEVALMSNVDAENADPDRPGVRLSTVHQAKGLEWPVVIIIWCDEDMFPSAKAIMEDQAPEERRLFYVALTRAKDSLLLCVPSHRHPPGGGTVALFPSRFIKELPADLVSKRYGLY